MAPPAPPPSIAPRWYLAALASLVIVGAALRIWQTRESLWIDELHTAWCAGGSLAEVAARAAIGNQSPVFFWLEWWLVRLLGPSELVLRLPSVVAGSLVPLALFLLARRWTGSSGVGLLAAALAVVDPGLIFFATEARPYALVQLISVVHVGIMAELLERPSASLRVAFVAGATLLFYLHYTAALLIAAELALWWLAHWIGPSLVRYRWPSLAVDLGLIALFCLPALGELSAIFGRRENWATFVPRPPLWYMPVVLVVLMPWSISAIVILAVGAFDAALCRTTPENQTDKQRRATRRFLALCWLLVPFLLASLATATDVARLFHPRYLAAGAPAAMLLTAFCAGLPPWRWARFSLGAAIIAAALWISGIAQQFRHDGRVIGNRKEDWRAAVAWLNEQRAQEPYPALVASGLIEADALRRPHDLLLENYCLLPVTALYRIQAERADLVPLTYRDPGKLQPEARRLLVARGGGWVLVRAVRSAADAVAAEVKSELNRKESAVRGEESEAENQHRDWRIIRGKSFGAVHVLLIVRQHGPPPDTPDARLPTSESQPAAAG